MEMSGSGDVGAGGQVTGSAAEVYERLFVPALFGPWARRLADAARLAPGDRVLDVACGTGVVAREAAGRVGPDGAVTGLDLNEGMLAVARRIAPAIEWRDGRAEELPLPDRSFDAVLCQFGLMFFTDRAGALREMWRVLAPGGRLAVAVWDSMERSPGYAALAALLAELFGDAVAAELDAPFALGDVAALRALLDAAGVAGATLRTEQGTARFPSLHTWLESDARGWTLAAHIDDAGFARLCDAAGTRLARFVQPDGTVAFPVQAHIVTASRG